jgi:uncharacterized protein with PIN domain/sulfur carrier protein ThiS
MPSVAIRFYEELNDFLPPARRKTRFAVPLENSRTLKDLIESLGVPHTEVDVVLVNGSSVDFSCRLRDNDDIAVYPVFGSFNVSPLVRLRPLPLRTPSFIGDVHLGRLCRMLRTLGFDTLYRNDYEDREIVAAAIREKRVILTRDIGVLKHKAVTHGYWVRSSDWREQTREVVRRFDLAGAVKPFTVCSVCNGKIAAVDKSAVAGQLEEKTRLYYDEFSRCESCGKIFWKGSHYGKLRQMAEELTGNQVKSGD